MDWETADPAEILAGFSGEELFEVQQEAEKGNGIYNGLILAQALEIAQQKSRMSIQEIADWMGVSRKTVYHWANGLRRQRKRSEGSISSQLLMLSVFLYENELVYKHKK